MSFVGKSSQGTSGFSPQAVPDCVLWLDALDSNTLTLSGSNISAWRDKSGRANNSTGVINTPTRRANSINGRPAVFISSNAVRGSFSNTISNRELHCFMVCTALSTNGSYPRFLGLDDGVNGEYNAVTGIEAIGRQGGANFVVSRLNSGAIVNAADDVPHIVSTFNIISNHSIALDGSAGVVTASSGTTGNFAISKWNVGCETGGSLQWNPQIYIGEVLVFSNALSSNVRYQIEGYLATKWGLTSNLPALHPFRSLPPFMRSFQPTDISGCAVWLDGEDSGAMTFSGSAITRWLDKSGSGRHADTCGNGTVTLGSTTTGRRAPTFAGSNYLSLSNATTLSPTSASYFVHASATTSNNRTAVAFWANSRIIGPTYYWNVGANLSYSPYTWLNSNAVISVVENSASNTTLHYNGNSVGTMNYQARTNEGYALSASNRVVIGAHWSLDNLWIGTIQEVIFYDGALTPGQRQQVETYLTNKWGTLGSTPSNHYARLAPALAVPFIPTMVSDCALWLDGMDRSAMVLSGTTVTQWTDKTGNGRHGAHTGSPQLGTTTTGRQCVVFSGTNYFTISNANTLSGSNSTYFIQCSATTNGRNLFNLWGNARSLTHQLYYNGVDNLFFTSSTLFFNSNTLACIQENTSASLCSSFFNGTANNTMTTSARGTNTDFILGGNYDGGNGWIGNIQEVIFYNRVLTTSERQAVEGYITRRWGTSSLLPATSPYKYGTLI